MKLDLLTKSSTDERLEAIIEVMAEATKATLEMLATIAKILAKRQVF